MTSQADLATGLATAHQDSRQQIKPFRARQLLQRASCYHFSLVESALRLLARMQGNRNHRDPPNRHRLFQVGNRLCHHAPQNYRRGTHLLELKQMDQVTQFAVIATVGDGPLERRIHALTKQAPRLSAIRL